MTEWERKQKLLDYARDMRKAPSDAERKIWQRLRRKQLDGLKFRRQVPVGPFIADFLCDECNLVIEIDGSQHDDAADYDERRTTFLESLGLRVLRFSAWDAVRETDAVLETILRELGREPF